MVSHFQKKEKALEISEFECGEGIMRFLGREKAIFPHWKHELTNLTAIIYIDWMGGTSKSMTKSRANFIKKLKQTENEI